MALRDKFNKLISYFDTDDISEVEEETVVQSVRQPRIEQPQQRREHHSRVEASESEVKDRAHLRPVTNVSPSHAKINREQMAQTAAESAKTTIVIKYPKKYEDAQEIVDALILNECILIDFQYMIDAQARRCLDFIDGASKVLYGNLQKVSSSMFLLTPANVIVDFEEIGIPHNGQDISYDYDMKR
ncbi:cell division protein SepF [Streptococcus zalophi]|uniref:Cell division protein SepF n=1 Tax=Streptococcus zalophi TaxID=640031 RepID=A0A934UDH8_9STRE|nr:cell division protein SepF [Streptococcus zalophi]MBJ8349679.1 cell division protein SepF [Streptococcus zalophi]MCR8967972.1 cell division protein SepF [Streptococcus zalophi]